MRYWNKQPHFEFIDHVSHEDRCQTGRLFHALLRLYCLWRFSTTGVPIASTQGSCAVIPLIYVHSKQQRSFQSAHSLSPTNEGYSHLLFLPFSLFLSVTAGHFFLKWTLNTLVSSIWNSNVFKSAFIPGWRGAGFVPLRQTE